jgi:hypothetical protein
VKGQISLAEKLGVISSVCADDLDRLLCEVDAAKFGGQDSRAQFTFEVLTGLNCMVSSIEDAAKCRRLTIEESQFHHGMVFEASILSGITEKQKDEFNDRLSKAYGASFNNPEEEEPL